jgi:hypothetical protein
MKKRLHIPERQLESGQKAVDIMEDDKSIAFNVTKDYAIIFVDSYNKERYER